MERIELLKNDAEIQKAHKSLEADAIKANELIDAANQLLLAKEREILQPKEIKSFSEHPKDLLTKKLVQGVEISGMKLADAKILSLLDVNLSGIEAAFAELDLNGLTISDGKFQPDPKALEEIEESFTQYAQTKEEILIAQACLNLVDAFDKLQNLVDTPLNYIALGSATRDAVNAYFGKRCLKPDAVRYLATTIKKQEPAV